MAGTFRVRIAAAVGTALAAACGTEPRPVLAGCYALAWRDERGRPETGWFPAALELAGGPDTGAVASVPGTPDSLSFWIFHGYRRWDRIGRDSAQVTLRHGYGGTTLRFRLRGDTVAGWATARGDDIDDSRPERRWTVTGRRVPCGASSRPAT